MTLRNDGTTATAVVGASSPAADAVELHTHVQDGEVARMRQVERFDLAVGQDRALQPAGDHIMLIGLHQDLEVGQQVELTLRFTDGSEQLVTVPVQPQPMPGQDQAASH
jgi:copper(I)-binding protein